MPLQSHSVLSVPIVVIIKGGGELLVETKHGEISLPKQKNKMGGGSSGSENDSLSASPLSFLVESWQGTLEI